MVKSTENLPEIIEKKSLISSNIYKYRKTPLLVPGVDQFSNSNSFVLDQLVPG
jgi:hypothetical protein